jgi:hypothetical protein
MILASKVVTTIWEMITYRIRYSYIVTYAADSVVCAAEIANVHIITIPIPKIPRNEEQRWHIRDRYQPSGQKPKMQIPTKYLHESDFIETAISTDMMCATIEPCHDLLARWYCNQSGWSPHNSSRVSSVRGTFKFVTLERYPGVVEPTVGPRRATSSTVTKQITEPAVL